MNQCGYIILAGQQSPLEYWLCPTLHLHSNYTCILPCLAFEGSARDLNLAMLVQQVVYLQCYLPTPKSVFFYKVLYTYSEL